MPSTPDPTRFLPLTPPLFQVLVSLADDDRHGYAILKDIEDRTGGTVRLSTGTLYGIIKRLLADALILDVTHRRPADDERRRYYRLTPLGRHVALAETERLERAVAQARATLRLRGSSS